MRNVFTIIIAMVITVAAIAQAPQKMDYQAVIRDASGALVPNLAVGMRVSILQGSATGTVVYQETYNPKPQTNSNGLVTVEIGSGTPTTGSFTAINWAAGPYYLKTETDPSGGASYSIIGTSQFLSVPYALNSKISDGVADNSITSAKIVDGTITAIDLGSNSVTSVKIADGSVTVADLAANSVTTDKIITGGVTGAKIAQAGATNGQALKWNGATWAPASDETGAGFTLPYTGTALTSEMGSSAFKITNSGTNQINAIYGHATSTENVMSMGVVGRSDSYDGRGIYGLATHKTGITYGVQGIAESDMAWGVWGSASSGEGNTFGVYGQSASTSGTGVYGKAAAGSGITYGVYGSSSSGFGYGVYGLNSASSGVARGIYGESVSATGIGVEGVGYYAIYGKSEKENSRAIYGSQTNSNGYSGYFFGGKFYVGSYVGIGTSHPEYRLVVYAPGAASIGIAGFYNSDGNLKVLIRQNSNGCGAVNLYNTDGTNTVSMTGEGVNYINSGNLGIGTNAPAYKLTVNGTAWCSSGAWTGSDARWKKNIKDLSNKLPGIMALNPVNYELRTDEFPELGFNTGIQIGLIAQDVEKIFPELVNTDNTGFKAVSYEKLSVILLEGMKEQQQHIEKQQRQIDELKQLINNLMQIK